MTSQKAQIQALIKEIDAVLSKPIVRLPWVNYAGFDQQRRVLEQTREFLASLEQQMTTLEGFGVAGGAGNLLAFGVQPPPARFPSPPPPPAAATESAQQVLQAVLQEMSYLRTNVMQTLRGDVEVLQQQREALAQEIRLLEAQRQQYALPQQQAAQQQMISEFLQSLMGRLQENLTGQVAQMLVNLEAETVYERSLAGAPEGSLPGTANYQPLLSPSQRLEHLQRVQSQSDQLLLKLDSTLRVIFESLQTNMQSYEESLGRGLDKMHSLGQQGEAMFTALVNRLAQQLGRDASAYLQSSLQPSGWDASAPPLPPMDLATGIGMIPGQPVSESGVTDAQIDRLMNQFGATPSVGEAPSLNALNQDLSRLNLETAPPIFELPDDDDLTFFQVDESSMPPSGVRESDPGELTTLQINEEITRIQSELEGSGRGQEDQLDSALDLLSQLGVPTTTPIESRAPIAEAGAIAPDEETYDELDGLYESMFGGGTEEDSVSETDQNVTARAESLPEPPPDSINLAFSPDDIELFDEIAPAPFEETSSDQAESDVKLFDGLTDPAADAFDAELALESQELTLTPEEMLSGEAESRGSANSGAQSLESFLFDEPFSPDEVSLEEPLASMGLAFLGDDVFTGEELNPTEPPLAEEDLDQEEVITSLAELIGLSEPEADASFDRVPSELEMGHEHQDDVFEPASPDETLIAGEDAVDESQIDLHLPDTTLTQLTADLSSLEGLAIEEFTLPALPEPSQRETEASDLDLLDISLLDESELDEPGLSEQDVPDLSPSDLEAALELSASEPLDESELALTFEPELTESDAASEPAPLLDQEPVDQDQAPFLDSDFLGESIGLDALFGGTVDELDAPERTDTEVSLSGFDPSQFHPSEFTVAPDTIPADDSSFSPDTDQTGGQDEFLIDPTELEFLSDDTTADLESEPLSGFEPALEENGAPNDDGGLWEELSDSGSAEAENRAEPPQSFDESQVSAWDSSVDLVQELTLDDFIQAEPLPSPSTIDAGIDALFAAEDELSTPDSVAARDEVFSIDEMMEPPPSEPSDLPSNAFIEELFGLDEPEPIPPLADEVGFGLEEDSLSDASRSSTLSQSFTDEPLDVRTIEELLAFSPTDEESTGSSVEAEPDLILDELDALNLELLDSTPDELGEEFPPTLAALFSTDEPEALFEPDQSLASESGTPDWTLDTFAEDVPAPSQSPSQFPNLMADVAGVETDTNAFTLEGLESLFEDIPDVGSSEAPAPDRSGEGTEDWTVEGAFGDLEEGTSSSSMEGTRESSQNDPAKPEDSERNWF